MRSSPCNAACSDPFDLQLTDSMKMFNMGLENGKPEKGVRPRTISWHPCQHATLKTRGGNVDNQGCFKRVVWSCGGAHSTSTPLLKQRVEWWIDSAVLRGWCGRHQQKNRPFSWDPAAGVGLSRLPRAAGFGVQPEWFYKGDGSVLVKHTAFRCPFTGFHRGSTKAMALCWSCFRPRCFLHSNLISACHREMYRGPTAPPCP